MTMTDTDNTIDLEAYQADPDGYLAKLAGITTDDYRMYKIIEAEASEEIKDRLDRREIGIPEAYRLLRPQSFEEWLAKGQAIEANASAAKNVRWNLGDWINDGEHTYGQVYAHAVRVTGRKYGDLSSMASVAKRVPLSNRLESLSWAHHAAVADLDVDLQHDWLTRAAAGGWSKTTLREIVTGRKSDPDGFIITTCGLCGMNKIDGRCGHCAELKRRMKSEGGTVIVVGLDPVRAAREMMKHSRANDDYLRRYIAEIQKRLDRHEVAKRRPHEDDERLSSDSTISTTTEVEMGNHDSTTETTTIPTTKVVQ